MKAPSQVLTPGESMVETRFFENGDLVRVDSITIASSPVELALP